MKGTRSFPAAIVLIVLLALSAGLTAANSARVSEPSQSYQAALGTGFTYQGQLLKDGSPVDATCTMVFALYDDAAAGNRMGSPITSTVAVTGGLFTVLLNTGGEFGLAAFNGAARWLETAVQCPGDPGFSTLTPRQALTATPYALSLRPGAIVDGAVEGGSAVAAVNRADYSFGLWGQSDAYHDAVGVRGLASSYEGGGTGVWGEAATTDGGVGVRGEASGTSGANYGVYGVADSPDGTGVYGSAAHAGVAGQGDTYGVYGLSAALFGRGVYGEATATFGVNYGLYGLSASNSGGVGVRGEASATTGTTYGVQGVAAATAGRGVYGLANASSGSTYGVYGLASSTAGTGVGGLANADSGDAYGVYGRSNSTDGVGVYGYAAATSGTIYGVYGEAHSTQGAGVYGYSAPTETSVSSGVRGESHADQGHGVWGIAYGTSALACGVRGDSQSEMASGVAGIAWGTTGTAAGIFGQAHSLTGYAGLFSGNVYVNGILSADVKLFKIDHPFDPANKYLYHYTVESAEVLNQYSGNVVLGADGSAWIELPDWFSAINRDLRYQLTPVGAAAPGLYVAQEVSAQEGGAQGVGDNRFQVAGGPPGLKVSWEVTAVRSDPYIQRYGAPVEVEKPAAERGTYLHPELYGQPEELGLDYPMTPRQPDAGRPAPDAAP